MYNDETGWKGQKKSAWMWIMANDEATVYYAAESRGKGIVEQLYGNSMAYSMHDGYGAYKKTIPKDKQMYCWSHLLRFAHEEAHNEANDSEIALLKNELVEIYHLKDTPRLKFMIKTRLEAIETQQFTQIPALKVQRLVTEQKEGLLNALLYTKDGTNNLAERELRQLVISRKMSFGSNTYAGMETTAILASIVQTIYREKNEAFFAQLRQSLRKGIRKTYPRL